DRRHRPLDVRIVRGDVRQRVEPGVDAVADRDERPQDGEQRDQPSSAERGPGKRLHHFDAEAGSGPSLTTILPTLSPVKSPRKALGAFSMPSTMVCWCFTRLSRSQPPTSRTNSG